ncbi:MAG TPA: CDP-diacylglycerol--serine O-phosphatidyltransferase [Sphingomonadales bacterium]
MRERRRLQFLPARSLVPNAVTVLALCAGMTSIKFALAGRWEMAAGAIIIAGIFDMLDGRVARMMKGASRFGAELDSLSDVISFGVAPAVLVYLWTLSRLGGIGWVLALGFAVCCALRLARFNVMSELEETPSKNFTGVPAPMAAGLALWPFALSVQFGTDFFRNPALVAPYMALLSFLMVSRLPTLSLKKIRVKGDYVLPMLVAVGLFAASLSVWTWGTVSIVCFLYALSIPLTVVMNRRGAALAPVADAEGEGEDAVYSDDTDEPRRPLH